MTQPLNLTQLLNQPLESQTRQLAEQSNKHNDLLNVLITLEPLARLVARKAVIASLISTFVLSTVMHFLSIIGVPTKLIYPIAMHFLRLHGIPMPWGG